MVSPELIEKHTEDIDSLKKEVRSLKRSLRKLTRQVEQLQLVSFQDQLNCLDKRITSISSDLTEVRRLVFRHFFGLLRETAIDYLHNAGHLPPVPPTLQQTCITCSAELQGYYLEATERLERCKDMKEMENTLDGYWDKLNRTLRRHHFPEIGKA